jgi:hypothetical protein
MENLNEMIKETPANEGAQFNPEDTELQTEDPSDQVIKEDLRTPSDTAIPIVTFGGWFQTYHETFTNIHQLRLSIRGVDPDENLIVSIDDPDGVELEPGVRKRALKLFDDAVTQPVLDLPPSDMQIYNNGFRVIYPISEELFIKMYGVKTGLIASFCYGLDGGLIPYDRIVAKKKINSIEIPPGDIENYRQQLTQPIDLETLHLLYRQSVKADAFETKGAAINWLLARQDSITDINHHLEIDKVIMTLLS